MGHLSMLISLFAVTRCRSSVPLRLVLTNTKLFYVTGWTYNARALAAWFGFQSFFSFVFESCPYIEMSLLQMPSDMRGLS